MTTKLMKRVIMEREFILLLLAWQKKYNPTLKQMISIFLEQIQICLKHLKG